MNLCAQLKSKTFNFSSHCITLIWHSAKNRQMHIDTQRVCFNKRIQCKKLKTKKNRTKYFSIYLTKVDDHIKLRAAATFENADNSCLRAMPTYLHILTKKLNLQTGKSKPCLKIQNHSIPTSNPEEPEVDGFSFLSIESSLPAHTFPTPPPKLIVVRPLEIASMSLVPL